MNERPRPDMAPEIETQDREEASWQIVPCLRCRSMEHDVVHETKDHLHGFAGTFYVVECRECGLWFQNPQPSDAELMRFYPAEYLPHQEDSEAADLPSRGTLVMLRDELGYDHLDVPNSGGGWRSSALLAPIRRRMLANRLVPPFVPNGKLIELGCAAGQTLERFAALGWKDLEGVELIPAAAQKARAKGFHVHRGRIEDVLKELPDASYDVVYSTMVLEHLKDPFQTLKEIARILRRGGYFYFSTVCRGSADERWFGEYWGGFDLPRHMFYPTRNDLELALAPHFRELAFSYQSAPVDYVRSATWRNVGRDVPLKALGTSGVAPIATALALLRRTSRVSVRCVRS